MVEITDRESAQAWLSAQTTDSQRIAAVRSALRAVPEVVTGNESKIGGNVLPVLRAVLTSCVSVGHKGGNASQENAAADLKRARDGANRYLERANAGAAKDAAHHGLRSMVDGLSTVAESLEAARSAADAAGRMSHAFGAPASAYDQGRSAAVTTWIALSRDATFISDLQGAGDPFATFLWPDDPPDPIALSLDTLDAFWRDEPDTWDFWREWYDGMLSGQPMDWKLQEAVALIPDEIWEAGPKRVAQEIRRLRIIHRTRVAALAVYDEGTGRFELETDLDLPVDTVTFVRQRAEMALENALAEGASNGFTEEDPEARTIRNVIAKHPDDGSLLAVFFFDACMSLQRNIGDRYPRDTSLIGLKNALYAAVEEICEQDEVVKARCARLAALANPPPVSPVEKDEIAQVPDKVADLVSEDLGREIRDATEEIVRSRHPAKIVRARLTNWLTTIAVWIDRAKKAEGRGKWLIELVEKMFDWWKDTPDA